MSDPTTGPHVPHATVHLLRHGEVHNPDRVLYGRLPDYHLSTRGGEQARTAAAWFADHHGDRIVHLRCSPLERARETAAPLEERLGLDVTVDDRLIEAANGLEGLRAGTPLDLVRTVLSSPRTATLFVDPRRPSWGEPYREVAGRTLAAVLAARTAAIEGGGDAVCVSHQLPIYVTRRYLEGRPLPHSPQRRQCALASVTSLTFAGPAASPVLVGLTYSEPAGGRAPGEVPGA